MEDTRVWLEDASRKGARNDWEPFAANHLYSAFIEQNAVRIDCNAPTDDFSRRTTLPLKAVEHHCSLAFSTIRPGLLAIGTGTGLAIYDIDSTTTKVLELGTDRAITSLAWSCVDVDLFAIGHIDGRISIWSLGQPSAPLHVVQAGQGACRCLAWSNAGENLLAAGLGDALHLWHVGRTARRLGGTRHHEAAIKRLAWRPDGSTQILVGNSCGSLTIWDFSQYLRVLMLEPADDNDELFGELEDVQPPHEPLFTATIETWVRQFSYLSEHGILALSEAGDNVQLFDMREIPDSPNAIWEATLGFEASNVTIVTHQGSIALLCSGHDMQKTILIPDKVIKQLGCKTQEISACSARDDKQTSRLMTGTPGQPVSESGKETMKPVPISMLKAERGTFSRTAEQMRVLRSRSPSKISVRPATAESARSETTAIPITSPMTSSLDLPRPPPDEDDSPMPFLSPTIPSRKTSPSANPPLDGTLVLPPPPDESFDSLPSTAAPDSDSDDETFDGTTMLGSGNLMLPGGVNVPLPKSCGALFAPNGQLVTYFPPKPRSSAKADDLEPERTSSSAKVAKVFPTFGNLANGFANLDDESDSDSTASAGATAWDGIPPIQLPSSTPESHPWHSKFSPSKTPLSNQKSVYISVREIMEHSGLRPKIATEYRLVCRDTADGPRMAHANAQVALDAGLHQIANLWHMVNYALSRQKAVSSKDAASEVESIDFGVDHFGASNSDTEALSAKTLSTDHQQLAVQARILGESWLIARVLALSERIADLQTLGSISALILSFEAHAKVMSGSAPTFQRSVPGADYFDTHRVRKPAPRPIPLLRNDSRESVVIHQSPTKARPSSHASSRNPSQPTTPGLDSLSSTPPYPFPNLSRQGSRISASGSASPETHRSSFSAAAKYYAQSITEKFSNYGTSPPTKRLGTSPGNELSSSLPTGSWGKSVSFASTTDTAQGSRQSRTQSSHDDGYDSDRTIDDSSLPHTPRSTTGEITFKVKDAFNFQSHFDETEDALLPPQLLAKAQIWVRSYAEQLRTWDMITEAAELESLAGPEDQTLASLKPRGIVPVPIQGQRKPACSICYAKIDGLQQACSRCLHTMHLSCLTDFLEECGAADFECPTGCGCRCDDVPYEEAEWDDVEEVDARTAIRKRSLTDPRVWRARVEGASW